MIKKKQLFEKNKSPVEGPSFPKVKGGTSQRVPATGFASDLELKKPRN